MKTFLPALTVATLIALDTYVHGVWTDRWSSSEAVPIASAQLSALVPTVADWQSSACVLKELQNEQAGIAGSMSRRFENPARHHVATVFLACGAPGPMAKHTPESCYTGAGYVMARAPARVKITTHETGETAEFWAASFTDNSAARNRLRIYWSWRGNGGWEAVKSPRLHFGGLPCLYRLYVIRLLNVYSEALDDEHDREFLRRLVPALNPGLVLSQ